jgi:N-acetylmuramoyl-L-alanine amidase
MAIKICIDAGHGMANKAPGKYDPGAVWGRYSEADITLLWALSGRWLLNQMGVPVFLTRDDDRDVTPVGTRDEMALQAGCNLFLSIHCNSAGDQSASGTETFVRNKKDLPLANLVQTAALNTLRLPNRGIQNESKTAVGRLAVMDFSGPVCLLELGFITSPRDLPRMMMRETRVLFWQTLGNALNALSDA